MNYLVTFILCCRSGSVIATIHLTFDHTLGAPDTLLSEMQTTIPDKSDTDTRTNKVEAVAIVKGTLP